MQGIGLNPRHGGKVNLFFRFEFGGLGRAWVYIFIIQVEKFVAQSSSYGYFGQAVVFLFALCYHDRTRQQRM